MNENNNYCEKRDDTMCKILKNINGKSAYELLEFYNIPMAPPIQLSKLLLNSGISARSVDFSEVEKNAGYENGRILGAAISKGDNLTIFYRCQDSENRQRFTIAHELAHCCLHMNNIHQNHIEFRESNLVEKNEKEVEADIFAGELLIPKCALNEVYNALYVPSLETLAKIFTVSTNVMAARLDYLSMSYLKDTEYTYE